MASSKRRNGIKFIHCPCCDKKGYYKTGHRVKCRYCDYRVILMPGQDF